MLRIAAVFTLMLCIAALPLSSQAGEAKAREKQIAIEAGGQADSKPGHPHPEEVDKEQEPPPVDDSPVADYFAMPGIAGSVYAITAGVAPQDAPGYKVLSALNMSLFPDTQDVVDVGFNGEVFSYRQTPNGTSWGILGMGPTLRVGRLFLNLDINLISFRHQSDTHAKGWLPGLSGRVYLPLVNHGSHSIWSIFLPTPAAGFELWFNNKLDYDQIGFWVGLAWIGYVGQD